MVAEMRCLAARDLGARSDRRQSAPAATTWTVVEKIASVAVPAIGDTVQPAGGNEVLDVFFVLSLPVQFDRDLLLHRVHQTHDLSHIANVRGTARIVQHLVDDEMRGWVKRRHFGAQRFDEVETVGELW